MPAYQQCNTRKLEPEDHYVNHRTRVTLPNESKYKQDPTHLSGPVITYRIEDLKEGEKECGK